MSSTTTVDILKEWRIYSLRQAKMHNVMRSIYRFRNLSLAIPAILLSTVSGSANISMGSRSCSEGNNWLSILFGALGLSSAAMFSIHRYLNLPELQKEHDFYADEFEKLGNEITMQLTLDTEEGSQAYRNLAEFMKECKKTLDVLIDKAPPVFGRIEKRFTLVSVEI